MKKLLSKFGFGKSGKPENAVKPVVLGYAITFSNEELELKLFGSPKEILEQLVERGLEISEIAHLPETVIDAHPVKQETPNLQFHGGPHAEATMRLMDALAASDLTTAKQVLANAPQMQADQDCAPIPLIAYAASGDLEIVDFLLDHSYSPNVSGHFGLTPLHWAAARGYVDVVDALLASGGDSTSIGWFLLTPAEVASINGHAALAQKLKSLAAAFYEPDMWMGFVQRMGIQKQA